MGYINKEALFDDIEESVVFTTRPGIVSSELRGANKIIDRIKRAPAADVAEVRHGEWLDVYGEKYTNRLYECSVCKELALYKPKYDELAHLHYVQVLTPTCPNCGAKMDGKGEGE